MRPYYEQDGITIYHGDCVEVMSSLAPVDLILTDPPYFRVKNEPWDRAWSSASAFLGWLGGVADSWADTIKPNGSLYCFASPAMSARVEVLVRERFNVMNRIRWMKRNGWHRKAERETLRSYLSPWEEIIFAEQYGSDVAALGGSGYAARCAEVRGFVFEPLREYLDGERMRSGTSSAECNEACGNQMAGHYFTRSQWALPTEKNYLRLRTLFNNGTNGEYLRKDYEELRKDYEELRRPFNVTADEDAYDVWNFETVAPNAAKHPCEKPQPLLAHAINKSTRPGAVVLDTFMGTASTLDAARMCGRRAIGIDANEEYCEIAAERLAQEVFDFGGGA